MNREELIADLDWLKTMAIESRANGVIEGIDALKRKALRAQADSVSTHAQAETKLVYIKRWRTLVSLPIKYADEIREALATPSPERTSDGVRELTRLAAECHRAKWQFDLSEDYQPSKSAARALILKGFDELHRIGDMALKLRATLSSTPTDALPIVTRTHDVS